MADAALVSGQLSGFGFGKQGAVGTYQAPLDTLWVNSFDIPRASNIITATGLSGDFDGELATRAGAGELTAKVDACLWDAQGLPLIKGGIGFDTMSGASAVSFGAIATGGTTAGAQTIPLATAAPAPPTGINSWIGATMKIGTGATLERLPILGVSGVNLTTLPTAFTHPATDTVSVEVSHCFQPNVGANKALLDYFSLVGQWGGLFERRVQDMRVSKFSLKGTDEMLSAAFDLVGETDIVSQTASLTTLPYATGESSTSFYVQMDGGLILKDAVAASAPSMRKFTTALNYDLSYSVKAQKTGGSRVAVVRHVFDSRTQAITWSELAGQGGSLNTILTDYVETQTTQPVFIWYLNPVTNASIGFYFPKCVITTYDPVGPSANPVSYNGSIKVLPDRSGEGLAVRVWASNGTTVAL